MSRRSYRLFSTSGQGERWVEGSHDRRYPGRPREDRVPRIGRTVPRHRRPGAEMARPSHAPDCLDARAYPRVRASWAGMEGQAGRGPSTWRRAPHSRRWRGVRRDLELNVISSSTASRSQIVSAFQVASTSFDQGVEDLLKKRRGRVVFDATVRRAEVHTSRRSARGEPRGLQCRVTFAGTSRSCQDEVAVRRDTEKTRSAGTRRVEPSPPASRRRERRERRGAVEGPGSSRRQRRRFASGWRSSTGGEAGWLPHLARVSGSGA